MENNHAESSVEKDLKGAKTTREAKRKEKLAAKAEAEEEKANAASAIRLLEV